MRKPGLGSVGIGLIGLGSTLFASPAVAAIECGNAPSGGTLSQTGDVCQLSFSTPGDFSFTVPASADELFALVVGGGSGGYINFPFNYAGSAGKVTYKDMSDSIGNALTIRVGSGGVGGQEQSAANGTDSSVSAPSSANYAVAYAGMAGAAPSSSGCTMTGWDSQLFTGEGARTTSSLAAQGDSCLNGQGAGVNPSLGDVDSFATSVPSIFSNLNQTFGTGGRIVSVPENLPELFAGDGGGLRIVAEGNTFEGGPRNGSNGIAVLRWRDLPDLANTGSVSGSLSALAAGLIAAGAGMSLIATARRRTAKKH